MMIDGSFLRVREGMKKSILQHLVPWCVLFIVVVLSGCLSMVSRDETEVPTAESPKFGFISDSGQELLPVLPPYLLHVDPNPGEKLTQDELLRRVSPQGPQTAAVCLGIDPRPLLEVGDFNDGTNNFPDDEAWLERVTVLIDELERVRSEKGVMLNSAPSEVFFIDPETGDRELLYIVPANAPYTVCYESDLQPGMHLVRFEAAKTSGEVEVFEWSFEILE